MNTPITDSCANSADRFSDREVVPVNICRGMESRLIKISNIINEARQYTNKLVHGDIQLTGEEESRLDKLLLCIINLTDYPEGEYAKKLLESPENVP